MTDTIKQLKETVSKNQKKINKATTEIKRNLSILQKNIQNQSLMMEMLKEQTKDDFYQCLSEDLKLSPCRLKDLYKNYKQLASREKIDKRYLELIEVIDKPTRKQNKQCKQTKSPIMKTGDLVGNIRSMSEKKEMSRSDKEIIKTMLQQLQNEL